MLYSLLFPSSSWDQGLGELMLTLLDMGPTFDQLNDLGQVSQTL